MEPHCHRKWDFGSDDLMRISTSHPHIDVSNVRSLATTQGPAQPEMMCIQSVPSLAVPRRPAPMLTTPNALIVNLGIHSQLDYGCIVYGTASNTNLRQLNSIHNAVLRLAPRALCTSPVSSMYMESNGAPLDECQLKLSMHYYLKTRASTDNPAHHALHEFDPTTRDLYLPGPNGKRGMTRPPTQPIGLKVEEAMTSAEIDAKMICP